MIMFTLGGELILVGPGLELDSLVMSRGLVFFVDTLFQGVFQLSGSATNDSEFPVGLMFDFSDMAVSEHCISLWPSLPHKQCKTLGYSRKQCLAKSDQF